MDVIAQNVHWLVPEENCPCDIFLHFRGQYPQAVSAGHPVSFAVLEKLAKVRCEVVYIRRSDLPLWQNWAALRHAPPASASPAKDHDDDAKDLYGNKRAELISYLRKSVQPKNAGNESLASAMAAALRILQKVMATPMLDWYFQQFHEPPNLFYHTGRVAFTSLIFAQLHALIGEKELETLSFATLVHELEGDPATSLNTVVSQQTIASLERHKRPVPAEVITLIHLQDELCSGKGFPQQKKRENMPVEARIFTLFNHLDHYRLKDGPSRRARFENAKQQMSARKADYDDALWASFWEFWEKQLEVVG